MGKGQGLGLVWAVALVASALLRWAGVHWPDPLAPAPALALALVLGPPALVALLLLWDFPSRDEPRPSGLAHDRGQSSHPAQDEP